MMLEKSIEFEVAAPEEKEPPSCSLRSKEFYKKFFPGSTEKDWSDWKWQLKNRITTIDQLSRFIKLTDSENSILNLHKGNLPLGITPYYFSLINVDDVNDPIRKCMIPRIDESIITPEESVDPLDEGHQNPVSCIVHRYPDRVLFLSTKFCSSTCRYSLVAGTKILMSDYTPKNIEDVKVGDKVISHNGNVCNVYDTFNRVYDKDVIKFKTSRNLTITTTQEHPFLVLKRSKILCNQGASKAICKPDSAICKFRHPNEMRSFVPEFMDACNIEVGDFIATPLFNKMNGSLYTDPNMAYLLGMYIAEGDLPTRKNGDSMGVRFSFGYLEEDTIAEKIVQISKTLGFNDVYKSTRKEVSNCTVRIFDKNLAMFVKEHCGMYSDKKKISEHLINNSSLEFKRNMLLGMLDGDGCVMERKKDTDFFRGGRSSSSNSSGYFVRAIEFNTASLDLAIQIQSMLIQLKCSPSLYIDDSIGVKKTSAKVKNVIETKCIKYSVRVTNKKGWNILFNDKLKKGSCMSFNTEDYMFSEVKEKTLVKYNDITYDLSVEGDESYVANFMAVHNCTRARMITEEQERTCEMSEWDKGFEYIKNHPEVRDVLISGGDPLTMTDSRIEYILSNIRKISHVEIVRLGTKVPAVLPQRITCELVNMLKKYHPLFISLHFTHGRELTEECEKACELLADAGIPLGSQTVLLNEINDNSKILGDLFKGLLKFRVRPYYLYSCDMIQGSGHFRTTIEKGIDIMKDLQGKITGYAIPKFIVDAPKGLGKIPVQYNYLKKNEDGKIILENYEGKTLNYGTD